MLDTYDRIKRRVLDSLKDYCFLLKPALYFAGIYLLALSALLRANFYYIDDLGRAAFGWGQWDMYARYLSVFFSHILHADSYLTDVSPLPQIVAVIIMAFASALTVHIMGGGRTGKTQYSIWLIAAVLPLGLNPYFLECFSYKYDAPYMALSILVSIVPLLFWERNSLIYSAASVLGTLFMCMSYQASAGIYPMLVVIVCIRMWIENQDVKTILKKAIISAVSYLIGLLLFQQCILRLIPGYYARQYTTSLVPFENLITNAKAVYESYLKLVFSDFKKKWLALSGVLCFGFLHTVIFGTKQHKVLTAFLSIPALLGLFALSFGVYPFLESPGYSPRCMYGIGVFLAFLGVFVLTVKPRNLPIKLTCLAMSWMFFVFAFTYGNALNSQREWMDFRLEQVAEDLAEWEGMSTEEEKSVQITGTIGYSPVMRRMPQSYRMLNRLVPILFRDSSWWYGPFKLFHYYGFTNLTHNTQGNMSELDLPVIVENRYHTIRGDEEHIWIVLHEYP